MEIPNYEPFYIDSLDALRAEADRLGLELPLSEDLTALADEITIGSKRSPNRFCIQPMIGNDAEPNGAPSALTTRRYRRYAQGGAGLIWIESTIPGTAKASTPRLALNEGTADAFRAMLAETRAAALERWGRAPAIVLQLNPLLPINAKAHSFPDEAGFPPVDVLADEQIADCRDALIDAAVLAAEIGFDGVDVQACRGALAGTLLGASTREGDYGGSFENRTRFLVETLAGIRKRVPELALATRLSAYDGIRSPFGFGVDPSDYRKFDLDEPTRLARLLHETGLDLLNANCASPNLAGALPGRAFRPHPDGEFPDEHPLMVLDRQLQIARALRESAGGIPVVGSGFSWLRQFLPQVAAGAAAAGWIDFVGLGRSALADPVIPAAVVEGGGIEGGMSCMVCFACNDLRDQGSPVGCPIRDSETYGAEQQESRHFAPEELPAEASRCHLCEAAPCTTASRTGSDIPAFIKAYREGDDQSAYEIIRASDPLPELTAQLTPGWLHSEGACVEAALSGRPIPILDIQYAIAWQARERGETGVRLPDTNTDKQIAIVGGGPAGISAAVTLLERGHDVDLFEVSSKVGGTPARVIPADRLHDTEPEIGALLAPAIHAGRLRVRTGAKLGETLSLDDLHGNWDAVLLAMGVWQEQRLAAPECDGVIDALTFLEQVKQRKMTAVPKRVAVLAGGDCAMDAATTAKNLGAEELFLVYSGSRSDMHWHMSEDWFSTPGVQAMMHSQPADYELADDGTLAGLQIHDTELGRDRVLPVGLVVEAMGLESSPSLRQTLAGIEMGGDRGLIQIDGQFRTNLDRVFATGGITNGGASVARCVNEGRLAAEQIHLEIS